MHMCYNVARSRNDGLVQGIVDQPANIGQIGKKENRAFIMLYYSFATSFKRNAYKPKQNGQYEDDWKVANYHRMNGRLVIPFSHRSDYAGQADNGQGVEEIGPYDVAKDNVMFSLAHGGY